MEFPYIAGFVKKHRLAKGISQSELASAMGYENGQFISNVERGKCSVPAKKGLTFCRILNADPQDLKLAMVLDYTKQLDEVFKCENTAIDS